VEALANVPFEDNDDGFAFDTQIIVQLIESGRHIVEIPIPTYYGDEVCYVNGLGYARDVMTHVARYRAHKMGFGSGETAFASKAYDLKNDEESSHGVVQSWLADSAPLRVLDLGCSDGALAARLRKLGHDVTGVDQEALEGVLDRVDRFVPGDLEDGVPTEAGDGYDVVVLADVLEHVRRPEVLLREACSRVAPGGWVVASVPNAVHWYPRVRMLLGRFDYDRRGILDSGHLRFFTRRSFERLARRCGCSVVTVQAVGLPLEVLDRGGTTVSQRWPLRLAAAVDSRAARAWPNLFAYQYVFRLEPNVAVETS
jgi:SAM-dependent methyltransferase